MIEFVLVLGVCFALGSLAVVSNPSPYYGVLGLVVAAVVGCGWLVSLGVSFVSLVLVMVYLGGMLVVFVCLVLLAADPYPESWVSWGVVGYGFGIGLVVLVGLAVGGMLGLLVEESTVNGGGLLSVRLDFSGVAVLYSEGVGLLLIGGWGCL
ncbi:NU6M oxidoreductase, partial [Loxia curvirostra]|nr:NU6M oxidoreductase [Loxia curvirostra]